MEWSTGSHLVQPRSQGREKALGTRLHLVLFSRWDRVFTRIPSLYQYCAVISAFCSWLFLGCQTQTRPQGAFPGFGGGATYKAREKRPGDEAGPDGEVRTILLQPDFNHYIGRVTTSWENRSIYSHYCYCIYHCEQQTFSRCGTPLILSFAMSHLGN